ncbi:MULTISPECIES: TetR/AcrR family transcriptional regulator [Nocardiaceae]|jgi:AcrR family transcriptional regulator|uniref:TetR/AcrR family transcriptional regulator n=1 Tax=Nocardiaceae TaxID=85025 RepID=UPI001E57F96E|nr:MULTISPECIES: TetR/AcrR family transcriptional regulator [Rhodococcus]MCC8929930.1 TetR/AcrR family transcriptional regulator [Rhodococcus sp. I2R]MCZ4277990.1 TetR/AcrR family transcriptional regulator [Rhodococcus yunnanensis]
MTAGASRLERRKARTRAALIAAGQRFIADGKLTAPILEITQAADVGMGSFYNHFESKEELFAAAVESALDSLGDFLDALGDDVGDPAEVFAQSFRIAGRLFRLQPELSRVLVNSGSSLISSGKGLAPRAARDIAAASKAGRFRVEDPDLALALVAGSLLGLGQLLLQQPDRDDAAAADAMTAGILIALGLPTDEAHALCSRPLPSIAEVLADIEDTANQPRATSNQRTPRTRVTE